MTFDKSIHTIAFFPFKMVRRAGYVITAPVVLKKEDHEFDAILGYIVRLCLVFN